MNVSVSAGFALVLLAVVAPLRAQALDAPPPLPASSEAAPELPASSKAAAPAGMTDRIGPIIEDAAVADLPPAKPTSPETRIEQRRQGNRIVELTVTPAGSTRSYTIVNREGQRPLSVQDLSSGLSTPRFFKYDF